LPGGEASICWPAICIACCFNPRHPLPGGEAWRCLYLRAACRVSIHATRCRVAKHLLRVSLRMKDEVSIHATRCRVAKHRLRYSWHLAWQFQSTPPVAGWRSAVVALADPWDGGFNPRHPLPGGEAVSASGRPSSSGVSIHATRCRVAKLACQAAFSLGAVFQSTPPVAGWRSGARERTCAEG